jgi:hypothetical protein
VEFVAGLEMVSRESVSEVVLPDRESPVPRVWVIAQRGLDHGTAARGVITVTPLERERHGRPIRNIDSDLAAHLGH